MDRLIWSRSNVIYITCFSGFFFFLFLLIDNVTTTNFKLQLPCLPKSEYQRAGKGDVETRAISVCNCINEQSLRKNKYCEHEVGIHDRLTLSSMIWQHGTHPNFPSLRIREKVTQKLGCRNHISFLLPLLSQQSAGIKKTMHPLLLQRELEAHLTKRHLLHIIYHTQ